MCVNKKSIPGGMLSLKLTTNNIYCPNPSKGQTLVNHSSFSQGTNF